MSLAFPPGFLWGVATAGHQVEGGDTASDTSFLEQVAPTVFQQPSGDACRSWELWQTDLDLAAGLGLNAFRFSVEWARIEPVPGEFSEDALDHYAAVVDGCCARGLAPVITLSHFTSPHWFAMRGAWLDPEAPELFARFTRRVIERLGGSIRAVVTFNEPNLPEMLTWSGLPPFVAELERATLEAAGRAAGVERYRTGNVMIPEDFPGMREGMTRAHLAAKQVIAELRPDLEVGLSISMADDVALPGGEALRDRKRAEAYDYWLRLAADDDFIGVQNYERLVYGPDGLVRPAAGTALNEMGSAVEPQSLRGAVEYAYAVSGVPVFVTEHGVSTDDDTLRAGLLEPALEGLAAAMAGGVPVLGYCHWTLMDNFEWIFGYTRQLGLFSVDRGSFARIPKPSAAVYAELVGRARAAAEPGFQPPAFSAPGEAERQHPARAVVHPALTYAMPDGYRPLQLDLYVPSERTGPVPCVVWIHGGAWLFGTRLAPPEYWPAGSLFQSLIDRGLAVASIDYRHSREASFPAQLHDAKAAVRYLRRFAGELGIDAAAIGVWGESAGGHLAALLALVDAPELEGDAGVTGESSAVAAAVVFYGVADVDTMPSFRDTMPAEWIENLESQGTAEPIDVLLAGSPYPPAEARRLVSPVHHVRADAPPFLLVHGEDDGLVPFSQSEQLLGALRDAGASAELLAVPGADHVFVGTDPLAQIERGADFLREQLVREPAARR
ncbi:family 1 glycosylhydrolase [Microbacterium fluvii]|uniref:Family 1 glycosylhydrolase n=1 Tax=Microbacterium fluvii TaxID=415215 RepID=A0ABW2HF55_9MICO|nr:family 1 glycosylhydrolase [Microbacterium fluvii]MCU4672710.1 family 1 glycosylhydrolase [Microbacterium fluvii]